MRAVILIVSTLLLAVVAQEIVPSPAPEEENAGPSTEASPDAEVARRGLSHTSANSNANGNNENFELASNIVAQPAEPAENVGKAYGEDGDMGLRRPSPSQLEPIRLVPKAAHNGWLAYSGTTRDHSPTSRTTLSRSICVTPCTPRTAMAPMACPKPWV